MVYPYYGVWVFVLLPSYQTRLDLGAVVASTPYSEMATPGSRVFHCHQRVISSGDCCSHLWQVLVRSAGSIFS